MSAVKEARKEFTRETTSVYRKQIATDASVDPLGTPLTIAEVAELLGCSVWTVRQRHLRKGLPYFRAGSTGKLVFYRSQVTHWILQQQELHRGRR